MHSLYLQLVEELETAGKHTLYAADANEPDPRYRGYGVRAPAMKALLRSYKDEFKRLDQTALLSLSHQLLASGFGEQKTIALHLLEQMPTYFLDHLDELEQVARLLHGWSKIDTLCNGLMAKLLALDPQPVIVRLNRWNQDEDYWLRRASVVAFTRKVGASGQFTNEAIGFCERLKFDEQDMVRKGVGWCLKDIMRGDRQRVLEFVQGLRQQGVSSVITLYALRDIKGAERATILGSQGTSD